MKTKILILLTFVIIWQSTAQTASFFLFNQQNLGNTGAIGVANGQTLSPVAM